MIPNSEWSRQLTRVQNCQKWEVTKDYTLHNHSHCVFVVSGLAWRSKSPRRMGRRCSTPQLGHMVQEPRSIHVCNAAPNSVACSCSVRLTPVLLRGSFRDHRRLRAHAAAPRRRRRSSSWHGVGLHSAAVLLRRAERPSICALPASLASLLAVHVQAVPTPAFTNSGPLSKLTFCDSS